MEAGAALVVVGPLEGNLEGWWGIKKGRARRGWGVPSRLARNLDKCWLCVEPWEMETHFHLLIIS